MSLPLFQGVLDSRLSGVRAGSFSMVGLLVSETTKHAPDPERQLTACSVSAWIFDELVTRSWYPPTVSGGDRPSTAQAWRFKTL